MGLILGPLLVIGVHYWMHRPRSLLTNDVAEPLAAVAAAFEEDEEQGCAALSLEGARALDLYGQKGSDALQDAAGEHFNAIGALMPRCADEEIGPSYLAEYQAILDVATVPGAAAWKYGVAALIAVVAAFVIYFKFTG